MGAFVSLESHPKIQTVGQPLSIEFIDIWAAGNYPTSHRKKKEITRNPEGSRVVADQVPIAAMICLEALLAAWCRLSFDRWA